jgi:tRNA threonylcarbamoyladenosine biosynthesis protein TsaE
MSDDFTLDLADEAATILFGRQLASVLVPNITLFMQGDLGAGKTTMVRGILRGLGFNGKVKSPTYTILETYDINLENGLKLSINHFDLYRFNDEEEWEAAGFRDAFNADSVSLIEWPEKAMNCLPQADIEVHLSMRKNGGRIATLVTPSDQGKMICQHLGTKI